MAVHHRTTTFSRLPERRWLAYTTALLLLLFGSLYYNLQPQLKEATEGYAQGSMLNLSQPLDQTRLRALLTNSNYIESPSDATFLVGQLSQKLQTNPTLANLGALNKKTFSIPIAQAETNGGPDFRGRVQSARMALGFVSQDSLGNVAFDSTLFRQEATQPQPLPASVQVSNGTLSITGTILSDSTDLPLAGVLVRLQQHFSSDSLAPTFEVRTNAAGTYTFNGLPSGRAFSVLPLHHHFEFGNSQGTDNLTGNLELNFRAKPQTLRLFGSTTYQQLKEDKALTVRTPDDFKSTYLTWVMLFLVAFWAVHLFWTARKFTGDTLILPMLMLLTGISTLMMFAIQDPLRDTLRGNETVQGVVGGLIFLALFSQFDFGRWYSSSFFDFLHFNRKSNINQVGYTWLIGAFILTIIVFIFGSGPEGSGVKVNLSLGAFSFQPSEITKYLVVIYFAGYFTVNTDYLRNIDDTTWRLKNSLPIMLSFVLLIGVYLFLGDMGPAMVLCFTFLIFYSSARGDFGFMLFGATIYGFLLFLVSFLGVPAQNKLPYLAVTVLYGVLWYSYGYFKKSYKESAIFIVILIAAFVFGELAPKVGQRLADRNNMFLNKWDNSTFGGDQVAHGIWSLASGGWAGQGLGQGLSKVMPANHTDMILPAIGEEMGLFGLIAIFVVMGVLLHRTLLIARRNAQSFSFYLCAGIAIVTGTQFLLMASGSMGTVPLTGVSVPFLSFGRVSMIINLAAFGVVMGVSSREGATVEREYIQERFDNIIASGSFTFSLTILKFIALVLVPYQIFKSETYIVKPALVVSRAGERIFSINPRINILTRKLGAGNIYDRNGLLLATSEKDSIQHQRTNLETAGASDLNSLLDKRLRRYYPFGDHLFFWTGDFNSRLLAGSGNGYFAEFTHLAELRGFDTTPDTYQEIKATSNKYRTGRFSPQQTKEFTLPQYDYSPLADMLQAGINSSKVSDFKAQNRDIKLSVDAALQTQLQRELQRSSQKDKRISVVILNANTGDVLASALNPLPDRAKLKQLADIPKDQQKFVTNTTKINGSIFTEKDLGMTYETPPGSTAKILTGIAALNRLGPNGVNTVFNVSANERIRTKGNDPDPTGPVDMRRAIVHSSNVYFIRIANEHDLDPEMQTLYETVGMRLAGRGGYHFYLDTLRNDFNEIRPHWQREVFERNRQFYDDPRRFGTKNRYRGEFSAIAWGQGQLEATPLALGRMAGSIATNGVFHPSRFLMERRDIAIPLKNSTNITRHPNIANLMEGFMLEQSRGKISRLEVAGKTGTPERVVTTQYRKDQRGGYLKDTRGNLLKNIAEMNDAWYVFFAHSHSLNAPLVTVVRIERTERGSGSAVELANQVVVPVLFTNRYFIRQSN